MPSPTPTPFNVANVRVTEYPQPDLPLYVGAGPDGAAYFGNGANGTGSNLYRFASGALTQTLPAAPPNGYDSGGGVYGITVTPSGSVYWLSAYLGPSFAPNIQVECGGSGTASLCEPTAVDEPTSMLVDAAGTFWLGGLSFEGGGQIATASQATGTFGAAVMQLVNGPGPAVWGVLQTSTETSTTDAIGEFAVSGSSVQIAAAYPVPMGSSIGSMTVGSDGAFWFTDYRRNAIGRMDKSGAFKEYPLPEAGALGAGWYGQSQIATACDGAVWFSEPGVNKIGRIDAQGAIQEIALQHANALPGALAATPAVQGKCISPALWVGEQNANTLAAVTF